MKNEKEIIPNDLSVQTDTLIVSDSSYYNEKLKIYLDSPLNFEKFRKQKNYNDQSHTINPKNNYYYVPDSLGFYYLFFIFQKPEIYTSEEWLELCNEDGIRVVVYMFGNKIEDFGKKELIDIKSRVNDPDLNESNFVGKGIEEIISNFGENYIKIDSFIIYKIDNKMLTLKVLNDKVVSFRFLKTNKIIDNVLLIETLKDFDII